MLRRKFWMTVLATALLGASSAQAQIKVGITMSASGPGAALGQPQSKTVAALPKEIAGQKVTYVALDDQSDPTKASQNARKMIAEDKVDILIGSSLTPVSLPMIDVAAEAKTPLLTLAAGGVLVQPMDDKKKWVFKVVPNDDIMTTAILRYMVKIGVKKLGYIGFADGYGEGYYNVLEEKAPQAGIQLTTHEVYARSDASVTGQILKIIASKPDAVFVAGAGTPAVLPQRALRERGYKGPIYTTDGVANNDFIRLGGKDIEGSIFAGEAFTIVDDMAKDDPFRAPSEKYIAAYQAVYNETPSAFGANLWDSMVLVENAIPAALKAGKPGTAEFRAALRDAIEVGKEIYLCNGLSNMSPTNHNGYDERSAFLIQVKGGKFRLVK
ncbi:ABC transporter substrate-binding protein [Rhodopseudomonas sp. P2A-2r]|uniref:ABC transporter substrate-binding protein n=1 Tax=unclassified Rhodopseudomonas TaxID=2638247 RepID=UPI0022347288|nr:ABC transporter substrate-binding protein [Rhodopseudomonas sp. P2A-2r]UZE50676.1 ABC transporter substrate-binding protein [Rhodopseudomonas sp. P2A-2r]